MRHSNFGEVDSAERGTAVFESNLHSLDLVECISGCSNRRLSNTRPSL